MKRIASVIGVPPEFREEYERHHEAVWPGVLDRLRASNIVNYSICRFGHLLFSYCEHVGADYEGDMAKIAANPVTQRWWEVQRPLQRPVVERAEGEWWHEIPEIFHLD